MHNYTKICSGPRSMSPVNLYAFIGKKKMQKNASGKKVICKRCKNMQPPVPPHFADDNWADKRKKTILLRANGVCPFAPVESFFVAKVSIRELRRCSAAWPWQGSNRGLLRLESLIRVEPLSYHDKCQLSFDPQAFKFGSGYTTNLTRIVLTVQ